MIAFSASKLSAFVTIITKSLNILIESKDQLLFTTCIRISKYNKFVEMSFELLAMWFVITSNN